jgi:hypothetical protein
MDLASCVIFVIVDATAKKKPLKKKANHNIMFCQTSKVVPEDDQILFQFYFESLTSHDH